MHKLLCLCTHKGALLCSFFARVSHVCSALNRAGSIPGFSLRDDGAAIVCSKRGLYEASLADYNRKHAAWQQLQAALGSGGAHMPAELDPYCSRFMSGLVGDQEEAG